MVHSKCLYRPSQRHSAGNWFRIEIGSAVPVGAMALYRNTGSRPKCHDRYGIYRHAVCHRPAYVIYRNMQRYVTTIERSHQRCLKNLHHAQEKRRTLPPPPTSNRISIFENPNSTGSLEVSRPPQPATLRGKLASNRNLLRRPAPRHGFVPQNRVTPEVSQPIGDLSPRGLSPTSLQMHPRK